MKHGVARWRIRRTAVAGAAAVMAVTACAGPVELGATIERVVEAGPQRDSPAYRTPDPLVAHTLAGTVLAHLSGADDPPVPDGLTALEAVYTDGRPVRIVTEDLGQGTTRGLGAYAVREGTGAPPGLVVEVPHPRADRWTEDLGVQLFTALDAQVLSVAGAHRTAGHGAADVAHEPASAFAAVDRAVVGPGTVVLQVHGFDESEHEGSSEVVLSSAESVPAPLVEELAGALEEAHIDVCVYDGQRCKALAGTRNVEAAHARTVGATFVHVELAEDLRKRGPERDELVGVLADVLRRCPIRGSEATDAGAPPCSTSRGTRAASEMALQVRERVAG